MAINAMFRVNQLTSSLTAMFCDELGMEALADICCGVGLGNGFGERVVLLEVGAVS
jgi:hypothetical protein